MSGKHEFHNKHECNLKFINQTIIYFSFMYDCQEPKTVSGSASLVLLYFSTSVLNQIASFFFLIHANTS